MNMKQVPNEEPDLVSLSVRVPRADAERLREIAGSEFRPVAAHLRRLILQDIQRADADLKRAA